MKQRRAENDSVFSFGRIVGLFVFVRVCVVVFLPLTGQVCDHLGAVQVVQMANRVQLLTSRHGA